MRLSLREGALNRDARAGGFGGTASNTEHYRDAQWGRTETAEHPAFIPF